MWRQRRAGISFSRDRRGAGAAAAPAAEMQGVRRTPAFTDLPNGLVVNCPEPRASLPQAGVRHGVPPSAGGPRCLEGGVGIRVTGIAAARGRRGQPILACGKLALGGWRATTGRPAGIPTTALRSRSSGGPARPSLPGCLEGGKIRSRRGGLLGDGWPARAGRLWLGRPGWDGPPASRAPPNTHLLLTGSPRAGARV